MASILVLTACLLLGCRASKAETGLAARFPLDEGSGTTARDASGNGNHAQIHGAAWTKSGEGSVLSFDGQGDYARCGDAPELDLRGPVTVSAWVWPEEVPGGEVGIAGKHFSSYLLTYYKDRQVYWYIGSGGNHVSHHVTPGMWTHIAGTFDGSVLRLYCQGELAGERRSQFEATPAGRAFLIGCVPGDPQADDPDHPGTGFFNGAIADVRVYARALSAEEIRAQYTAEAERRFAPVVAECVPVRGGRSISQNRLIVRIGEGGVMQIGVGDRFCVAESTFSYPGNRIRQNALSRAAETAEPEWRPEVSKVGRETLRVMADGAHYRLERLVRIDDGRVEVEDKLTSLASEPVGVLIRHHLTAPKAFRQARLGTGSAEPIVFVSSPDSDIGIVAEDDVSRVQFTPFCQGNRAGFRLNHFGLDAGASRTFRWAVYLAEPAGDPLGFTNRVRDDWGSNCTILGPASFFDANSDIIGDPDRLKRYLQRRKLRIAMLSPWLDYDPGSMDHVMPRDEYKAMMQRAMAALKAADPDMKCLGCIETDWVTIDPSTLEGGDRLPVATPERRGPTPIGPELAKIIEESDLPWKDSMKRDREGGAIVELYMRGGKPQLALGVFPAPGNYQARFLMEQARFLAEEVGLDGFYIDEFSLYWVDSHDTWDGTTVDIDRETGSIVHKYTSASLAGAQPRRALCDYAVANGLVMVANTWATTAYENAAPIMRFAETWSRFDVQSLPKAGKPPFMPDLAGGQLGTPIGLGVLAPRDTVNSAELLMRGIILYLRHGMLYYHYFYGDIPESGEGSGDYGPINHMFPTTPVRLFEGGIEGEERTITCVSGSYAWRHEDRPTVLVFGPDGREKDSDYDVGEEGDGWVVDLRLNDWADIAVIEP